MTDTSDTVRLPLEQLRRQVADATGRSPSFVDLTDVEIAGNTLEVSYTVPDESVPTVEVVVEGPDGETDTTPVRLDTPSGLRVYGELLRIEYAGRDAETDEILVSVSHRRDEDWHTLLGCGQMWSVETEREGEPVAVTCHVETPSTGEEDESGAEPVEDAVDEPDETELTDHDDDDGAGFLSGLG